MIYVSNVKVDPLLLAKHMHDRVKGKIVEILDSSPEIYPYPSIEYLDLELELRRNIVIAASELHNSRFAFETFHNSICNEFFWERTPEGGFLLRKEVKPSDAIRDIYISSSLYGTECATAMVIVFYTGILQTVGDELFNLLFPEIYLMDWQYTDNKLGIRTIREPRDYIPGDCRYFKNPDVDPVTPEWQGENVIDMGFGIYYGHGIGIGPPEKFIAVLNRHRIPDSQTSAFLMDIVTQPDYRQIIESYLKSSI